MCVRNLFLAYANTVAQITKAKKKNSCVSGSPTDPKISGPTLYFFFQKKKKKKKNQKKKKFFFFFFFFFFKFHSVTTHTQVVVISVDYYHNLCVCVVTE